MRYSKVPQIQRNLDIFDALKTTQKNVTKSTEPYESITESVIVTVDMIMNLSTEPPSRPQEKYTA